MTGAEEGVLSWAHTPRGQAILQQTMNQIKVGACVMTGRRWMPADRNPFPRLRLLGKASNLLLDATPEPQP